MRRVGMLLLVMVSFLFGAPAGATPAPPPVTLRVLSYNIHTGIGTDGVLDLARTAAAIRGTGADVVALQEVDVHWAARSDFRDQARDLADMLGMRAFFAPIYDLDPLTPGAPRRRYGVAVLSRFPVLHTENHEITRLSTQDPDPAPRPMPGFAEAVVLVRGVPVHVYSTHLDYRPDPTVREMQVADMLRIMSDDRGPRLLLGDFNAPHEAPALAPLWTVLTDAAPGGGTYPAQAPTTAIDFVTVSDEVRVRSASVPETLASDHRPVLAELSVPR
ncbi:endonuclease/exonuclease/phosphatase family protein [Actinophytocola sp. NPDC049390]|uniref:endonuclease/exonuclease/phosphatase family protein n=1 Tax=Actinophytocola sp. NPDC049390 TaxID=3363894 RepID=UPI003793BEEA